jgi:cytochrome c556/protein tyrosine phosphatase (PTP) superfamily phosphohydrolase (DUF442 family)
MTAWLLLCWLRTKSTARPHPVTTMLMNPTRLCFASLLYLVSCATGHQTDQKAQVAPPMPMEGKAYDAAGEVKLPETAPQQFEGLHNLYKLSDKIISGSEPEGAKAFEVLQEMGVKTIISVDGKAPDAALAARYGMRYVHVPIRYKGITEQERLEIIKSFRELPAPFYVHCFHGKHRGPAATALGRITLDEASREQAIAEMRQWFGTSKKYEGLYATIAFGEMPDEATTRTCAYDFAPAHSFKGFRQAMVDISRSFGTTEKLAKNDWMPAEDHPDANALNEARRTSESFAQSLKLKEMAKASEDFRHRMEVSAKDSAMLVQLLEKQAKGDKAASEEAKAVLSTIKTSCKSCHSKYRNAGY